MAKRKSLFDDRPVEINELTYIIKQDLSTLNSKISSLQSLTKSQSASLRGTSGASEQEGEHNKNVVVLLQGKLADVGVNFKEVLEVRTKNLQASRSRQQNFLSDVSDHTQSLNPSQPDQQQQQSASPLYNTPTKSRTPQPGYQNPNQDILDLDPSSTNGHSALTNPASDNQILMMEEAQPVNTYINMRGEAIDMIERTINELGGVFGQLAAMVSEQGEQIQRIDANTEDVVDNVQGAQRELMKYWSRVSGNRWLIAKMFGVLMVSSSFPAPLLSLFSTFNLSSSCRLFFPLRYWPNVRLLFTDILSPLGSHRRINVHWQLDSQDLLPLATSTSYPTPHRQPQYPDNQRQDFSSPVPVSVNNLNQCRFNLS